MIETMIFLMLLAFYFMLGACAWLVIGIFIDLIWGLE